MDVWEEDHRGKEGHFHRVVSGCLLSTGHVTADVDLGRLAEVLFVRFLRSNVTIYLSFHIAFNEQGDVSSSSRVEYLHK